MNRSRAVASLLGALIGAGVLLAAAGPAPTQASRFPVRAFAPQIAGDQPLPADGFTVHFLDVGQGDSILVTVNGHRLLIDGGRTQNLALQRLQSLGVNDLDAIVATHPDADHVGGLTSVLGAFEVERIYVNGDPAETQTYQDFLA